MSVQAVAWAQKQYTGDTLEHFLLRELADEANNAGVVQAGQVNLAAAVASTVQTVGRKLKALQAADLVEIHHTKRKDGGNGNCVYFLPCTYDSLADLMQVADTSDSEFNRFYAAELRACLKVDPTRGPRDGDALEALGANEVLTLEGLDLEEQKPTKPRRTRSRDLAFEALCEATKSDPASSRTLLNRALREIRAAVEREYGAIASVENDGSKGNAREAQDEVVAREVKRRAVALQESWTAGYFVTPQALVTHWRRAGELAKDVDDLLEALA